MFCVLSVAILLSFNYRLLQLKSRLLSPSPTPARSTPIPSSPPHYELGSHFIVGYHDLAEVTQLVEQSLIGGIFLSAHNVTGKSVEQVKAEVDTLQAIQTSKNLPPLWVATDQEGGSVSRLSPPIPSQPALSSLVDQSSCTEVVDSCFTPAEREAVRTYASLQAKSLVSLGVNLNLAPVVDLYRGTRVPGDRYTHLESRSLGRYPWLVIAIADIYLDEQIKAGITPTLKHFPGLGRVNRDTHYYPAHLPTPLAELENSDWLPFQSLLASHPETALMLGHVTLDALDPTHPSSFSPAVIQHLRSSWAKDTLLITDDFSMYPVRTSPLGVAGATRQALESGVDLILFAYNPDLYYSAVESVWPFPDPPR